MQNHTQAQKSVKGPGNIFDIYPKWTRTLPLGISHGVLIEPLPFQQQTIQIPKLIFDTLLWLEVQKPTQALTSVKGQGNTLELNPKWARTLPFWELFMGY
jgi:hypothetical protein